MAENSDGIPRPRAAPKSRLTADQLTEVNRAAHTEAAPCDRVAPMMVVLWIAGFLAKTEELAQV